MLFPEHPEFRHDGRCLLAHWNAVSDRYGPLRMTLIAAFKVRVLPTHILLRLGL